MQNNINEIKWKKEQLKKGCLLASLAHAIMVAHYPEVANENSWDGMNYNIQDSEGTRGTITFDLEYCVAAFRRDDSKRINSVNTIKQAKEYFEGASNEIVKLAETEALQYLLEDIDGRAIPLITTAFWGIGERMFTTDSFDEMYENGGFLLERQVMDIEESIEAWVEYYDMSSQQCDLLKTIFKRKLAEPDKTITLTTAEIEMIGTDDPEGLEESKNSFEEIGVEWE